MKSKIILVLISFLQLSCHLQQAIKTPKNDAEIITQGVFIQKDTGLKLKLTDDGYYTLFNPESNGHLVWEQCEYASKSQNRELLLTFSSDSVCTIKNTFFCDKIDDKFREITINATYKKQGNMIIIKNINCKNNDCVYPPSIEIPIQENSDCVFLNNEGRKTKTIFDGRTYQSDYRKYGLVPNIDIDTIYIIKRKIILIKKVENGNFGFIFK